MQVRREDLRLARVVGESDEMLTLDIAKTDDHVFELSDDETMNQFYTILFVKVDGNAATVWTPWADD